MRRLLVELDLERKSALTAVAWGVWVIAFNTFDTSDAYFFFIRSATWLTGPGNEEWMWGSLIALVGLAQLRGLWAQQTWLRMLTAIVACTMWTALGAMFLAYNPRSIAAVIYGGLALNNAALYFQLGTGRRK